MSDNNCMNVQNCMSNKKIIKNMYTVNVHSFCIYEKEMTLF